MTREVVNIINGKPVPADATPDRPVLNPSTGETICLVADSSADDVALAVSAAEAVFDEWSRLSPASRHKLLAKLADSLEAHADDFVDLEVSNAGKPLPAYGDEEFPP
jgi:acyl-CoA reductase-like NAD-dependent aldehyde dehydrogenase